MRYSMCSLVKPKHLVIWTRNGYQEIHTFDMYDDAVLDFHKICEKLMTNYSEDSDSITHLYEDIYHTDTASGVISYSNSYKYSNIYTSQGDVYVYNSVFLV